MTLLAVGAIWCGSLLASGLVGWLLLPIFLRRFETSPGRSSAVAGEDQGGAGDSGEDDGGEDAPTIGEGVLGGGRWIGLLERLLTTTCILAGQPTLIAVVVAVKGLGRYPELRRNPGVAEQFIVGTLASLLIASWVSLIGVWALGAVGG